MKKMISALLLLILIAGLMVSALAVESAGDGSGGGSDEVLALESSSIPDGSTGVALDALMTLTFNKNVVNMSVQDSNMTCFSLADSQGNDVGINVLMGDDQINPDIKRIIEIDPKANLLPDTTYMLTISSKLTSKSGVSLPQAITLKFTTVSMPATTPSPSPSAAPAALPDSTPKPSLSPQVPTPSGEGIQAAITSPSGLDAPDETVVPTMESAPSANTEVEQAIPSAVDEATEDTLGDTAENVGSPTNTKSASTIWYILGTTFLVIALAAAIVTVVRKKKHK